MKNKKRILIDLPTGVLKTLKKKAEKINQKRKPYIEYLCIKDATTSGTPQ